MNFSIALKIFMIESHLLDLTSFCERSVQVDFKTLISFIIQHNSASNLKDFKFQSNFLT